MSHERFLERRAEFSNAVTRLQEAVAEPESEFMRDAVIQRFEFTFELAWNSMKLFLEHEGQECTSPRSTLKNAFAGGLIDGQDEADQWLHMLDERNTTSHAYNEALAELIHRNIVNVYLPLLQELNERVQSLQWE